MMNGDYPGRILLGQYSNRLKKHIKDLIDRFYAFDEAASRLSLYFGVGGKGDAIWYEFISSRFIEVLGSTYVDAPSRFVKTSLNDTL